MSIETHPWAFIDPVCGKPAYFRLSVPLPIDPMIAVHCEHIDGRAVLDSDIFACDSCGRYLGEDIDNGNVVDPVNWVRRETLETPL